MARVALATAAYNTFDETGIDLATATYDTLVLGADNGVEINYDTVGFIVLNNDSGGAAVYSFISAQPTNLANLSITVPDKTFAVSTGEMLLLPFNATFKVGSIVQVDCDVAGKLAVVR